jgi:hypothetical protein
MLDSRASERIIYYAHIVLRLAAVVLFLEATLRTHAVQAIGSGYTVIDKLCYLTMSAHVTL